jgi:hypothetical protein
VGAPRSLGCCVGQADKGRATLREVCRQLARRQGLANCRHLKLPYTVTIYVAWPATAGQVGRVGALMVGGCPASKGSQEASVEEVFQVDIYGVGGLKEYP